MIPFIVGALCCLVSYTVGYYLAWHATMSIRRAFEDTMAVHEALVTRALASEKVLNPVRDVTSKKPPMKHKTEIDLATDEIAELKRQEEAYFGSN